LEVQYLHLLWLGQVIFLEFILLALIESARWVVTKRAKHNHLTIHTYFYGIFIYKTNKKRIFWVVGGKIKLLQVSMNCSTGVNS